MTAEHSEEELPDPALFWRWVGKATRPVVGWVLAGLGVIAILIGYLGISRESLVAKQLPYLISGGIGGIAHGALLSRPDAPSGNGQRGRPEPSGGDLVALPTGRSFHRADCVMVDGKANVQPVTAAAAQRRHLEPCRLCEPESVTA